MKNKTISILVIVDVVGALASDTLDGNIYLIDNNQKNGSTDEGTDQLKTQVEVGDKILWNILPLEPEAFATVSDIVIDPEYCKVEKKKYQESDIMYWLGTVKKQPKVLPYKLRIKLGTQENAFESEAPMGLTGKPSNS